jgi:hypothetical protein
VCSTANEAFQLSAITTTDTVLALRLGELGYPYGWIEEAIKKPDSAVSSAMMDPSTTLVTFLL